MLACSCPGMQFGLQCVCMESCKLGPLSCGGPQELCGSFDIFPLDRMSSSGAWQKQLGSTTPDLRPATSDLRPNYAGRHGMRPR